MVDFKIQDGETARHVLPSNYNGLVYVLNGAVRIGDKTVKAGQAGWLNQISEIENSELLFESRKKDTHFILYAAQPHNFPVISHGPFIGDTRDDINRLVTEYQNGKMPHLDDLDKRQKKEYI